MAGVRSKLVVITGPTASGKSTLAVELAQLFGGEIINADSMQVYRDMDVGTAKPTIEERQGIIHHLIDVVNPDEPFNAAIYRSLTLPIIEDVTSRGKVCFIVGGTGLYIRTLLGGLLHCPTSDPVFRKKLFAECERNGSQCLHDKLKTLDPESALKIHPHDKIRVSRALEIIHMTNRPLSTLKREHQFSDKSFETCKICLQRDREQLYHRINKRSLKMIDNGLLEETRNLLKWYSSELKPLQSIGYRHMNQFLRGVLDFEEAVLQLQTDTRRYAKRQLTWFRADSEMHWLKNEGNGLDEIRKKIEAFL